MKKTMRMALCLLIGAVMCACAVTAEELVGEAQGYGGTLKVMVTTDQGKLASVQVTEHNETQGVGTRAIDSMPDAMVAAGTWDVDGVSGATMTSNALRQAVQDALEGSNDEPSAVGEPSATHLPATGMPEGMMGGMGMTAAGRIGPGQDDQGNQVYSFNVVFADALFDESGRVQHLAVDLLEVVTPNTSAASVFSGWPGQGGYTLYDDAQGKVDGKTQDNDETFLGEVSAWETKGQQTEAEPSAPGTWREQMDAYQQLFTGMTVDEIEAWCAKYCSDTTGRPLTEDAEDQQEQSKYQALTEEEKQRLAEVTASAALPLKSDGTDIIGAIRMAWEQAQRNRP